MTRLANPSKISFKSELQLPGLIGLAGDFSERRITHFSVLCSKLNTIENIKPFDTNLELRALSKSQRDLLQHGSTQVIWTGRPLSTRYIPFTCHPPAIASPMPCRFPPNLRPRPMGN